MANDGATKRRHPHTRPTFEVALFYTARRLTKSLMIVAPSRAMRERGTTRSKPAC
jgi:hypothetical protein